MSKHSWLRVGVVGWVMACAVPASGDIISLPAPAIEGGIPLQSALAARQSRRQFDPRPLSDQTLSTLLWSAFGVNRPDSGKRTAPSAVNWQQTDIYVARADGLFLYEADGHRLRRLSGRDIRAAAGRQSFVATAPVVLIYVADTARMRGANEEARTFYSATDVGFISQNVYLFCASENLATVVIGLVDKPALARTLDLRPDQKIILTQPVGYPPDAGPPAAEDAGVKWRDGEYQGVARGYIDDITVKVTIRNGRIHAVEPLQHRENRPRTALEAIPERVVETQGIEGIDAVTGATVTSRAVLQAVKQALEAAARP